MRKIYLDFETASDCDITVAGAYEYARHPSTRLMTVAWSYEGDDRIYSWGFQPVRDTAKIKYKTTRTKVFSDGSSAELPATKTRTLNRYCLYEYGKRHLDILLDQIVKPENILSAWNVSFERAVWEFVGHQKLGWPSLEPFGIDKFSCTMARARAHSLPGSLGNAAKALKLPILKDESGKSSMMRLTKAKKHSVSDPYDFDYDPTRWLEMRSYCRDDVRVEKTIDSKLLPFDKIGPFEEKLWKLDQEMNWKGVTIDRETIQPTLDIIAQAEKKHEERLQEIVGDPEITLSKREKLLNWLSENGLHVNSLAKDYVESLLKDDKHLEPQVREVLELKVAASKVSVKKYPRMKVMSESDGRVRNNIIYYGAGKTGRWSGSGIQLQNLANGKSLQIDTSVSVDKLIEMQINSLRTGSYEKVDEAWGDPLEVASTMLRSMFVPDEGKKFYFCDYSSIESRVLAWLAGQQDVIDVYNSGDCLYKYTAGKIYNLEDPQSLGKKSFERKVGKVAVLGLGYGCGKARFHQMLEDSGIELTDSESDTIVDIYRQSNDRIRDLWYKTDDAVKAAIRNPGTEYKAGRCHYWRKPNGPLYCKLPSGRSLVYFNPHIKKVRKWNRLVDQIFYFSVDPIRKNWGVLETYGASLVESQAQATARDIMAEAMFRLQDAGHGLSFTVHDEIIGNTDLTTDPKEIEEIMCQPTGWDKGLPLAAECETGFRYRK